MNRCRNTESRLRHESRQDAQDIHREHWDSEVRMLVPDVSDDDLQKYWEWDISPTDAADHIAEQCS